MNHSPPDPAAEPPTSTPAGAITGARATPLDRLLLSLATGLGSGYWPWGPGTAGSLVGVALAWGLAQATRHPGLWLGLWAAMFLLGVPICAAGIRHFRRADPPAVVYDEIISIPLTMTLVPVTPITLALGFLLFRFFDITKPWPVHRFEELPGGWGVMSDDACAGVLSAGVLWAIVAGSHAAGYNWF